MHCAGTAPTLRRDGRVRVFTVDSRGNNAAHQVPQERNLVVKMRTCLHPTMFLAVLLALSACAEAHETVPEISEAEVTAEVPELSAIHELMYPLWHDAFPSQDFDSIRVLVPQFEPMLAAVDSVELPGILRHKQEGWDRGKEVMLSSFEGLKQAVEAGETQAMLSHTEAFHIGYEQLVRVIRPLVPELEAFHQELYKLIHYYGPANDAVRMGEAVAAMSEKMVALRSVTLPERLSERQSDFDEGVAALAERLGELEEAMHGSDDDARQAAVDAVHSAYGAVEQVFE